jgi:hypothetical protein
MRTKGQKLLAHLSCMPDQCPNDGGFTVEQKRAAARKLANALSLLASGHIALTDGVESELQYAEVFGGIEDLPMDLGVVSFREPSRLCRHTFAYTIDWLLKNDATEIAARINSSIGDSLSDA